VFTSALDSNRLLGPDGTVSDDSLTSTFFGFCGIANPSRFEKYLADLGIQLADFFALKDHAPYSQTLITNLCKKAVDCGAERLVTTEKDFVKLRDFDLQLPLYVLQIKQKVELSFDLFILDSLKKIEQ
jgi:tetraacyldisaccharide 4'-kinase